MELTNLFEPCPPHNSCVSVLDYTIEVLEAVRDSIATDTSDTTRIRHHLEQSIRILNHVRSTHEQPDNAR